MFCQSTDSPDLKYLENLMHDVKTPMSIIYHNIQELEYTGQLVDSALENVRAIKKCWFRILKLVNDTNDQCNIRRGAFSPKYTICDIVALLREITTFATPLGDQKNVLISFHSSVQRKTMATDKNLLDRIIMNLISNSIKFTRDNGKIEILFKDRGDSVRIIVRDTGTGIPAEMIPNVFERYYRGGNSENVPGSGVGLPIVKEFTQLLGGDVRISPRRQGTEVILDFPTLHPMEAAAPTYILDDFNRSNIAQIEFAYDYLEA